MDGLKVITVIFSLLLLMVGADKFLSFMDPPCSMMDSISPIAWKLLGVLQIAGAVLIWVPPLKKFFLWFFLLFMLGFSIIHVANNTYDIAGSLFMSGLVILLIWSPNSLKGKNK